MISFFKNGLLKYATTEKAVGETPLVSLKHLRERLNIPQDIPLAYAGRLDPMASGKLLILIGDECKVQEKYHSFDKEYVVEILVGTKSDTGDVLGLIDACTPSANTLDQKNVQKILATFIGNIELPYPHFSSKTVHGKPLHTWTLENRLDEIQIPIKKSRIHRLKLNGIQTLSKEEVLKTIREKIETIPTVTDERKALGADFRRDAVRESWNQIEKNSLDTFQIVSFTCIASSGTYMRSLAEQIGNTLGSCGLAYSIHRTKIGRYIPFSHKYGFWIVSF